MWIMIRALFIAAAVAAAVGTSPLASADPSDIVPGMRHDAVLGQPCANADFRGWVGWPMLRLSGAEADHGSAFRVRVFPRGGGR